MARGARIFTGTRSQKQLEDQLVELGPWHFDIEISPGLRTRDVNRESCDFRHVASIDPSATDFDVRGSLDPTGGVL